MVHPAHLSMFLLLFLNNSLQIFIVVIGIVCCLGWGCWSVSGSNARLRLPFGFGFCLDMYGGVPKGFPLNMTLTVALYVPRCRYLEQMGEARGAPQLYADGLKCVTIFSDVLLREARHTTKYIGLVGQRAAPRKCVLWVFLE